MFITYFSYSRPLLFMESILLDPKVLSPLYVPEKLSDREKELNTLSSFLKNSVNAFVYGSPGSGKTVMAKGSLRIQASQARQGLCTSTVLCIRRRTLSSAKSCSHWTASCRVRATMNWQRSWGQKQGLWTLHQQSIWIILSIWKNWRL